MSVFAAELSSAFPFSGGLYGFARCTIGLYPAFLLGCLECAKYIIYSAILVSLTSDLICGLNPSFKGLNPVVWVVMYSLVITINTKKGKLFWTTSVIVAVFILGILIMYDVGTFQWVVVPSEARWPPHADVNYFHALPTGAAFFWNLEFISLTSSQVDLPKKAVARGYIVCVCLLLGQAFLTVFLSTCLESRDTHYHDVSHRFPLTLGFSEIIKWFKDSATLLNLPSLFGACLGSVFAFGQVICALSSSRLLPPVFAKRTGYQPWSSYFLGCAMGLCLCIIMHMSPASLSILYKVCLLAGFIESTARSIVYIVLRRLFKKSNVAFVCPLGGTGPIATVVIFVAAGVALVMSRHGFIALYIVLALLLVASVYYLCVAYSRQTLSDDEKQIFMNAHVAVNCE